MPKILLTSPLPMPMFEQIRAGLAGRAEIEMVATLDEAEFASKAHDAEILLNIFRKIDAKLLTFAPHVRFIQQLSVGYDNLDLAAIAKAGIMAANAPGANNEAVAEHTVMLILVLLKHFTQVEQEARHNKWPSMALLQAGIGDLSTATVGLVGFGAIGQAVAQRLRGFGPRLLYTSRHQVAATLEEDVTYVTLPELLASSSIVSLHLPLNEQTRHLLGKTELAQMRKGALLINAARGGLVDETALREALASGHLGGAGLDALENETDGGNPFTDLPQVIVTPHTASHSPAARGKVTQMAFGNIARYLAGENPLYLL